MHHPQTFSIPEIHSFVPTKIRPWILFTFFIIYQFSGGLYMAAVTEMSGSLALMHEDVMMAGFASLVGLALTFTIMFRLKFRFPLKVSLIATALGLIVCNLICMNTTSVPLLVAVCFVSGIFRMWGTFACNTTIQLWVTPKRDMSVWFCYIQLCVQGFLQLSGLTTIYISFLTRWEYMHWCIIGLQLCLVLTTLLLFNHQQMMKLTLLGIDWLGAVLWAVVVLCVIFVLNYGEFYDWFQSSYIWMGCLFGVLALVLNLWRASFIRHPYIANQTWRFRNVWLTFLLFIVVDILVSPSHYLEHLYTESLLGFDALNLASLNWFVLLGMILGAFFVYKAFAQRKWTYRTMTVWGFAFIVAYLLSMYFIIDYNITKQMLIMPLMLRGFGYIIIAICFITALSTVPFQYFWQSLTIQAFISACCGSLLGSAIITQVFKWVMKKNVMLLSSGLDAVNPATQHIPLQSLMGNLQQQAMLVSMKELYGWLCIFGVFCIMLFMLYHSSLRPLSKHPKFSTIRRALKHELKTDRLPQANG